MWHLLNRDLWGPMWPNIFAPGFWTLLGVAISHARLRRHVNRKHEELKNHIEGRSND